MLRGDPPLVARKAEIAALDAAWREVVATGRPRRFVVGGEAGAGLSALVRAWSESVDARGEGLVLWVHGGEVLSALRARLGHDAEAWPLRPDVADVEAVRAWMARPEGLGPLLGVGPLVVVDDDASGEAHALPHRPLLWIEVRPGSESADLHVPHLPRAARAAALRGWLPIEARVVEDLAEHPIADAVDALRAMAVTGSLFVLAGELTARRGALPTLEEARQARWKSLDAATRDAVWGPPPDRPWGKLAALGLARPMADGWRLLRRGLPVAEREGG